jgi:hypothetical protein
MVHSEWRGGRYRCGQGFSNLDRFSTVFNNKVDVAILGHGSAMQGKPSCDSKKAAAQSRPDEVAR